MRPLITCVLAAAAAVLALANPATAAEARDYYARPMNFDFSFRDTYTPEDIRAYERALKRKDFSAVIQWQPLLVVAADNGDLRSVRWMLENGVKATVVDRTGRDALFFLATRDADAVQASRAEIARLLLANGADPNRFSTGISVVRALVSGNRDLAVLQAVLAAGGDANGNPRDVHPPVCGAATPAFIDALHAAGARLEFPERSDFRSVADCLSLDDMEKKERKAVLKHLAKTYGIAPSKGGPQDRLAVPARVESVDAAPPPAMTMTAAN